MEHRHQPGLPAAAWTMTSTWLASAGRITDIDMASGGSSMDHGSLSRRLNPEHEPFISDNLVVQSQRSWAGCLGEGPVQNPGCCTTLPLALAALSAPWAQPSYLQHKGRVVALALTPTAGRAARHQGLLLDRMLKWQHRPSGRGLRTSPIPQHFCRISSSASLYYSILPSFPSNL